MLEQWRWLRQFEACGKVSGRERRDGLKYVPNCVSEFYETDIAVHWFDEDTRLRTSMAKDDCAFYVGGFHNNLLHWPWDSLFAGRVDEHVVDSSNKFEEPRLGWMSFPNIACRVTLDKTSLFVESGDSLVPFDPAVDLCLRSVLVSKLACNVFREV